MAVEAMSLEQDTLVAWAESSSRGDVMQKMFTQEALEVRQIIVRAVVAGFMSLGVRDLTLLFQGVNLADRSLAYGATSIEEIQPLRRALAVVNLVAKMDKAGFPGLARRVLIPLAEGCGLCAQEVAKEEKMVFKFGRQALTERTVPDYLQVFRDGVLRSPEKFGGAEEMLVQGAFEKSCLQAWKMHAQAPLSLSAEEELSMQEFAAGLFAVNLAAAGVCSFACLCAAEGEPNEEEEMPKHEPEVLLAASQDLMYFSEAMNVAPGILLRAYSFLAARVAEEA